MELFKRNKERIEKERQEQRYSQDVFEEYAHLVNDLCPKDFEVKVSSSLEARFILKGSDNWGFVMDREAAMTATKAEHIAEVIIFMSKACRMSHEEGNNGM